jgi:hypothetical protein
MAVLNPRCLQSHRIISDHAYRIAVGAFNASPIISAVKILIFLTSGAVLGLAAKTAIRLGKDFRADVAARASNSGLQDDPCTAPDGHQAG